MSRYSYRYLFNPYATPQKEPIPGSNQVENNAGGYAFALDKWARLCRFLILGSDSATYYQEPKGLTRENALCVMECWEEDASRTRTLIEDVSVRGLAPKNDPAIFALALGSVHPLVEARQAANAAVSAVCRTATHLFTWIADRQRLGGGEGRGFRRAVASWYQRPVDKLAFQAVKYRNREGWTHRDALMTAHPALSQENSPDTEMAALCQWMLGKVPEGPLPEIVAAHIEAMAVPEGDSPALIKLIERYLLPWEALPSWALTKPDIWQAMLPFMGLTALIRKLGIMTAYGAISQENWRKPADRLTDTLELRASRVHPFAILQALAVYRSGQGVRGGKSWEPVGRIIDALDAAFYASFENVVPTGKRLMLALDISGSMRNSMLGSPLSCREAAAAMALVTLAREPDASVYGFTRGTYPTRWVSHPAGITPLSLTPRQRLDDAVRYIENLDFGGTDCALPFIYAQENKEEFDGFAVYTDNETWAGSIHPVQALRQYRQSSGINAKSAVIGMTSTEFSIADPADGSMMDFVGFDASAPAVMAEFLGGSSG